jgi:hypothetical protein
MPVSRLAGAAGGPLDSGGLTEHARRLRADSTGRPPRSSSRQFELTGRECVCPREDSAQHPTKRGLLFPPREIVIIIRAGCARES